MVQQPQARWLSIVGIAEDGIEGLGELARGLIESAEFVFGGSRHLSLATPLIRGTARPWGTPFDESVSEVLGYRGRPVCVLASGDPFQHGVGSVLARHVAADETIAIPAVSAFSLAASRLLWPLPQLALLSLCGRSLDLIRPHLHPGARILALTSGARAPAAIAALLCTTGFGESTVTVLEALGGPRERIRAARASAFGIDQIDSLNTVAIEVAASPSARILPRVAGLPDELFEHDGQITKREIRALTLSALAPRHAELLWDIGAGSGSIAIEWMLTDPSLSAVAIERRSDRTARIRRNANAFGVPDLQVIEAAAPQALNNLPPPNAIFIGGGATSPGLIETAQAALLPNGRLVVNAVTLETEVVLLNAHAQHGGTMTRVEIHHARPVGGEGGRFSSWHPSNPIVQWTWVKP
ncbi:MAG: precorrin-6B C5,15-methyltransferase / cobalt-precorrin-6B C5,C15-methyltransferase [Gammaproteobacteria bacterium]|nr:precorrin-6B C5,15-methyltransferase / cobalt-precorrin-6B C5,C15-methyltransferase [Gammaproteobacteria bacterium]